MGSYGHVPLQLSPCETLWALCRLKLCLCWLSGLFPHTVKCPWGLWGFLQLGLQRSMAGVQHSTVISLSSSLGTVQGQKWVLALGNTMHGSQLPLSSALASVLLSFHFKCIFWEDLFGLCQSTQYSTLSVGEALPGYFKSAILDLYIPWTFNA